MKLRIAAGIGFIWLVALLQSDGKFLLHQTARVPIGRVLTNLQITVAANPQDVESLYYLARVHSMAYAQQVVVLEVTTNTSKPFFGYPDSDSGVPRNVVHGASRSDRAEALGHLTNAITFYQRAVGLLAGSSSRQAQQLLLPVHLGLAWCVDQSGQRLAAIEAYRDALQRAWQKEADDTFVVKENGRSSWDRMRAGSKSFREAKHGHAGPGVCYSEEIIRYLLALLDPKTDAKEIAQLEADRRDLRSRPRAITPLIVPLRDDLSLETLVEPEAKVAFDLDGSGELRRWGWITTNAAWLVFDHDGRGQITSGLQMFGNVTFWVFWRDGYAALSSLDDNHDGRLSGEELAHLALWQDLNCNGISEPGEVTALTQHGVTSLDCHSVLHDSGLRFSPRGIRFQNHTTRPSYDWIAPSR